MRVLDLDFYGEDPLFICPFVKKPLAMSMCLPAMVIDRVSLHPCEQTSPPKRSKAHRDLMRELLLKTGRRISKVIFGQAKLKILGQSESGVNALIISTSVRLAVPYHGIVDSKMFGDKKMSFR
jgi:hypothetical protein